MKDSKKVKVDNILAMNAGPAKRIPFSFTYGGRSSADLLPSWERAEKKKSTTECDLSAITYTDRHSGLEVRCEVKSFKNFPAVDWVLRFANNGKRDSEILEAVLPLDLGIAVPAGDVVLHRANGSTCKETDFLPIDDKLTDNIFLNKGPNGGRSSDGILPFFNLEWTGGGLAWAIGWSGQWSQQIRRSGTGRIEINAGQQTFKAKLHPGESIRTPRILLVSWRGQDRWVGHNLLRRLLLAHYVPRENGSPALPPVTANTWFTFDTGNGVTEANQLEALALLPALGVEAFWLDAGWFEGGWPHGVGSWTPKKTAFPRGLRPLGEAAHQAGMKFVVWFEPERVHRASAIAREHPEWVLQTGGDNGLFNLGDPSARTWLTDLLSGIITEARIDILRIDFNIEPLRFWQTADFRDRPETAEAYHVEGLPEPLRFWQTVGLSDDRQGITEARYVEGLYAMWDELRRRHPGLLIDNCASGGRRIDLETCSRSYPLWRSDTQCGGKANQGWDQVQTAGLSLFVPLHSAGIWGFDKYTARSVATTGTNVCPDIRAKDFPSEAARAAILEMKDLRPLYQGDYYLLTEINLKDDVWRAWQFDRPDLGKGFAMFFRRPKAPQATLDVILHGLDPTASYEVTFADSGKTQQLNGAKLARFKAEIPEAPGSALITYRKL